MRLQKFYKVAVLIAIAFMAASLALPNSGGNAHTPVPPTMSASPAIEQVELREGKLVFSELPQEGCGATNLITFELRACINLNQDKVVYYSILTGEKAVEDLGILIFIWLETSQGERVFPRFCEVSTHTLNIKKTAACMATVERTRIEADVVTGTTLVFSPHTPTRIPEGLPSTEGIISESSLVA